MPVSLKKPPKVNLSKPELPRKLPEYTPLYLIDEEETIKSISDPPPVPKFETKEDSVPPVDDISLDISLEARQYYFRKQLFFRILSVAVVVLAVALLIVLFIFLFNNVKIDHTSSSDVSTVISTVSEVEQSSSYVSETLESPFILLSEALNSVISHPAFILLLYISLLFYFVALFYRFLKR